MVANITEQAFIEECKAIITESVFTSRWALVEGYWLLGQRVSQEHDKYAKGNNESLQTLAKNINIHTRTLYYAIQAYKQYPDINTIPDGKNISWSKLVTKYLPSQNKSILECIHKPIVICSKCKKKLEDYNANRSLYTERDIYEPI